MSTLKKFVEGDVSIEAAPGAARGRCARSARSVAAGEVLLRIPALASMLHGEFRGRRCDFCFMGGMGGVPLKRCTRCRVVYYCGRGCQEADWQDHKLECAARVTLGDRLVSTGFAGDGALADGLLVGRCLRKPVVETTSSQSAPPQALAELETFKDRIASGELAQLNHLASSVSSVSALLPRGSGKDAALDALCRFRNNNFAVVDDLFISVGAGVFPRGASLNHSCAPNCLLNYELARGRPPTQIIRAMEDIPAGRELCHSYVDIAMPAWQRQASLQESYGFECGCTLCAGGREALDAQLVSDLAGTGAVPAAGEDCPLALAPPCADRDTALRRADALMQEAAVEEDAEKELGILEEACGLRDQWLHRRHLEAMTAHATAHTVAIAAQDWAAAERHCERLVEQYIAVYPSWHPISGLQMYTLGELKEQAGKAGDALAWYVRAHTILRLTHGEEHTMVSDLALRVKSLEDGTAKG